MWTALITTLIAAIIGPILVYFVKTWHETKQIDKQNAMIKYIDLTKEIYKTIEEFRQTLICKRVSVFKTENGGGIPQPGHLLYSSVLWESNNDYTNSLKERWQRQEIDLQYAEILSTLYTESICSITTKHLKKSSLLYNLYQYDNIEKSDFLFLFRNEKCFIYLVLDYGQEYDDNKDTKEIIRQYRLKLKGILEKMGEIE